MSTTTKDPIALARAALKAGKAALPDCSSPKSPHKFTQPQLFALLVLRQFLKTDYRGLVAMVARWSDLREALGLTGVPHYSTLCYAERRLPKKGAPSASRCTQASSPRTNPTRASSTRTAMGRSPSW